MNQSTINKKTLEFDATHSWNGYSYQGKVALVVVLDLIINKTKQKESLDPYKLEFEMLEDFSILKNDKHIQIHQVKSYGTESLSEYKDAVWLLLGKSVYKKFPSINSSYLHAASVITSKKGDIDSSKKLLEVIETYTNPSDSKSNHIASPLELFDYIKDNGLQKEANNKFELYTYSDGRKYCSLHDINEKVKEKIKDYYVCTNKSTDLENKGIMEQQINYCYNFLLGLIDNHVNDRHINRQSKVDTYYKEILFVEFVEILEMEYDKLPTSYYVYHLKNKLIHIFNNYYSSQKDWIYSQLESSEIDWELMKSFQDHDEGLDKIMNILKRIYSNYNDDEFLSFCNRISPHVQVKEDSMLFVDELIVTEFIKSPWISTLLAFRKEIQDEKLLIKMDKQDYLASTISHTFTEPSNLNTFEKRQAEAMIEATISDMAVNILENQSIHDELYDIDNIITGNINASLKEYEHKVTSYQNNNNDKENHHIMRIKNVQLVDLEKTINRRDKNE